MTLSVGSGDQRKVLLDDVTWRLGQGDRIGLVGVNGAGKTSLLRLITGALQPDSGRVRRGKTVESAVLSQDLRELEEVAHLRVAEAVEKVRGSVQIGGKEVTASQCWSGWASSRAVPGPRSAISRVARSAGSSCSGC